MPCFQYNIPSDQATLSRPLTNINSYSPFSEVSDLRERVFFVRNNKLSYANPPKTAANTTKPDTMAARALAINTHVRAKASATDTMAALVRAIDTWVRTIKTQVRAEASQVRAETIQPATNDTQPTAESTGRDALNTEIRITNT